MKKTLTIIGAATIVLSSLLAFQIKSENQPVQTEKATSTSNGSGYALQDNDQWK
jgi:hypothetical protein